MWHTGVYIRSSSRQPYDLFLTYSHDSFVTHSYDLYSWLIHVTHRCLHPQQQQTAIWLIRDLFPWLIRDSFIWPLFMTHSCDTQVSTPAAAADSWLYDPFVTQSHDSFVTRLWLSLMTHSCDTQVSTPAAAAAASSSRVWHPQHHEWVTNKSYESRMSHERVTTEPYAWVTNESYCTGVYPRSSSSHAPRVRDSHSVKLGENHVPPRFCGNRHSHTLPRMSCVPHRDELRFGGNSHTHTHPWVSCVLCFVQGGEDAYNVLSLWVMSRKRAL